MTPTGPDSSARAAALASATLPGVQAQPSAQRLARWTRALAMGALLGLIALGLAWELWLAPTGQRTLAVKVLPLLLFLPGLLRHRMGTYRALSLCLWFYVIEGVVRAFGGPARVSLLALAELALCALLFGAVLMHVRGRQRLARATETT